MGGLDHIIAGHLHNIGAPIELLRLIFEKIGTGKGIAISFDKTAARVVGNRGIPPAELPAGMLGADTLTFQTYRKGTGVECIECGHAINNDEPVNVELQLHQQLFAEGVDEVGGVRSASHMADLDARADNLCQVHIVQLGIKARQFVFDSAQRF